MKKRTREQKNLHLRALTLEVKGDMDGVETRKILEEQKGRNIKAIMKTPTRTIPITAILGATTITIQDGDMDKGEEI